MEKEIAKYQEIQNQIYFLREKLNREIEEERNQYVGKIQYYENFILVPSDAKHNYNLQEDIFIVDKYKESEEKATPMKMQEIYNKENQLIGYTQPDGKIEFTQEYIQQLKENFKEFYQSFEIEKRDIYLQEIKEKGRDEKELQTYLTSKNKELTPEERKKVIEESGKKDGVEIEDISLIEQSLEIPKEDIEHCTQIKDPQLEQILRENHKENGKTASDIGKYDNITLIQTKTGEICLAGVKNGKYEKINQDAMKGTEDKKIDLGADGKDIQKENTYYEIALNKEYKIGCNIDSYGEPKYQLLRDSGRQQETISRDITETRTTYPVEKAVEETMDKRENVVAKAFEKRKNQGDEEINLTEISNKDTMNPRTKKKYAEKIKEDKNDKEEEEVPEKTLHDRGNRYYY